MNDILLGALTIAVLGVAVFFISLLIELKKTVVTLRKTTEEKVNPVLDGLHETMQSVRKVTDNVADMTEDVKQFTGSVGELGQTFRAVNSVIGDVGKSAAVRTISFRTGVKAAFQYLISNLIGKGERL